MGEKRKYIACRPTAETMELVQTVKVHFELELSEVFARGLQLIIRDQDRIEWDRILQRKKLEGWEKPTSIPNSLKISLLDEEAYQCVVDLLREKLSLKRVNAKFLINTVLWYTILENEQKRGQQLDVSDVQCLFSYEDFLVKLTDAEKTQLMGYIFRWISGKIGNNEGETYDEK